MSPFTQLFYGLVTVFCLPPNRREKDCALAPRRSRHESSFNGEAPHMGRLVPDFIYPLHNQDYRGK
ncbi:hypothetical protein D7X87_22215 [bacterium D16-54]|nr:hypothetical protein D7X87_22215 [bacterium D16-54]RKJ10854.1 hypothetical protein D7X65_22430 [bacterium D16-56]